MRNYIHRWYERGLPSQGPLQWFEVSMTMTRFQLAMSGEQVSTWISERNFDTTTRRHSTAYEFTVKLGGNPKDLDPNYRLAVGSQRT